ncbi:MAG: hypothetical protein A2Y09_03035 [Planctomycetes bacterium GWA2_39_15]|nr:MAG: hypothetical protein A2Y09_03035 [Planctomycetes bacterium GWA2_39_15]
MTIVVFLGMKLWRQHINLKNFLCKFLSWALGNKYPVFILSKFYSAKLSPPLILQPISVNG